MVHRMLITLSLCFLIPASGCRQRSAESSAVRYKEYEAGSIDYAWLVETIKTHKHKDAYEFLRFAKESDLDFSYNFVLVYNSGSDQFASPRQPRIISYSKGARVILGIDPTDASRMEVITYSVADERFLFRQITFKEGVATFHDGEEKPNHKPAPTGCFDANCHRRAEIARPNWESYRLWPGIYGSADGQISIGHQEDRDYLAFIQKSALEIPYRYLTGLPTEKELESRRKDPSTLDQASEVNASRENQEARVESVRFYKPFLDNPRGAYYKISLFELTELFSKLNSRKIIRELIDGVSDQVKWQYAAVLASFRGCCPIQNYLPMFDQAEYAKIQRDLTGRIIRHRHHRVKALRGANWATDEVFNYDPMNYDLEHEKFKGLRAMADDVENPPALALLVHAARLQGRPTHHWSMSQRRGTYSLSPAQGSFREFLKEAFWELALGRDPDMKDFLELLDSSVCEKIEAQLKKARKT